MKSGDHSRLSPSWPQKAADHNEEEETCLTHEMKQRYDTFIHCELKQTQESSAATVQMEKIKQKVLKEELDRTKDEHSQQCMSYTSDLRNVQNLIDNLQNVHQFLKNVNKTLVEIHAMCFLKVAKVVEENSPETRKTPSVWKRVRHFLGLRKPQRWKKKKECSECNTPLSSDYYDRDGQLFCHEDYWAKYGYLCHGCDQTITTSLLMVAEGHKYHPGCFTCLKCQIVIGDGDPYALVEESKLLCGHCYCQSISTPDSQPNSSDTVLSPASDDGQRQEEGSLKAKKQSPNLNISSRRCKTWPSSTDTSTRTTDILRSQSLCDVSKQPLLVFHPSELRCGDLLGEGTFGKVFKVTHTVTDEVMVMKELIEFDETVEKTVQNEMRILRCLDHPNVVKFIGVLYKDQRPSLVMEYIKGGNLGDVIENMDYDLPWNVMVRFACDVAAGMEYVHSMNIMHRDLNSYNCLVKEDNTVVVADFGLSRFMTGKEEMSQVKGPSMKKRDRRKQYSVVGNPDSMAPEMLNGKAYDEKVDIFSFGTILCQIIGRVTLDPDYLLRTFEDGLDVPGFFEYWYPSDCPPAFFPIAVLCCDLDPDKRPEFSTLKEWLENLKMNVEIGLPLMPELDRLQKDFWEKHRSIGLQLGLEFPSTQPE